MKKIAVAAVKQKARYLRLVCLRLLADRIHNSSKAAAGAIGVEPRQPISAKNGECR
ncbi:hypothetical protein [Campylobacter sp.]|uniref:hypothetical protein n=1 Tax=Campylobacter sp. TaxID=205 RepID=UPI002A74EC0D|nr:hypothetical protein [Campylobacter sp.]MDY2764285.1 hypothetical protein [Campylobacter sp.]